MITCKVCQRSKPEDSFTPVKVKSSGRVYRRHICKACRRARESETNASPTAPSAPDFGMAPPPQPPPQVTAPVLVSSALEKVLVVPDTHVPYHDERAWQLMLAVARDFEPTRIIILGDFVDCYSISTHDKDPRRTSNFKWELDQARLKLEELESLGAKHKVYIKGNHEDRLDRFISSRAGPLVDMVDFDRELRLKENGWQVVPYKQGYDLGHVSFTHDTGSAGANAHRQSMNVYHGSAVIGHTHRLAYEVVGSTKGKRILAAMLGWLGAFESIDYVHKQKALRDWVHGFGVAFYEPKTGLVFLQPVPIVDGCCVVHGNKYEVNW